MYAYASSLRASAVLARRSSISRSLAAVSTGLAAPKMLAAGTGVGAGGRCSFSPSSAAPSASSLTTGAASTGLERGCRASFGLVRGPSDAGGPKNISFC